MACNTVRMNSIGRGICSTCKKGKTASSKLESSTEEGKKKRITDSNSTDQLIQNFSKNLLGEYLPLFKASIACICDLLWSIIG